MKLLKKVLDKLSGLHYPREYLCITTETFEQPLHAYLCDRRRIIKDITDHHSFVGYAPLVFAFPDSVFDSSATAGITIAFTQKAFLPNGILRSKDAIAWLHLKEIKDQPYLHTPVHLFEGNKGKHRFISFFHQFFLSLKNKLFQNKPGNVFLRGNLYKQVQIAYSLPRNISLITAGNNKLFNLFPTDLHGPLDDLYYVISLRHEGKACRQVMDSKKILLTQVDSSFYKTVYSLGKNHMQDMQPKEQYPFSENLSAKLELPVPQKALFYRELVLEHTFIYGIHCIMTFKILYQQRIQENPATLAHIHNTYATWRYNQRLPGNYLLR